MSIKRNKIGVEFQSVAEQQKNKAVISNESNVSPYDTDHYISIYQSCCNLLTSSNL